MAVGAQAWLIVGFGASLAGACAGCSGPTDPPEPPGGGREYRLSFEMFEQSVEPVLVARGCSAGGDCHGGGIRGTFALSPVEGKDVDFDFEQSRLQVTPYTLEQSPILLEPLAVDAGGTPHGAKAFASAEDPDYQAILAWVRAGEWQ
jgi:hypothetical protein